MAEEASSRADTTGTLGVAAVAAGAEPKARIAYIGGFECRVEGGWLYVIAKAPMWICFASGSCIEVPGPAPIPDVYRWPVYVSACGGLYRACYVEPLPPHWGEDGRIRAGVAYLLC